MKLPIVDVFENPYESTDLQKGQSGRNDGCLQGYWQI